MAQYQITLETEILHQLFLGNAKESGVNKLLESVLNQVLKAQVTEQISADYYQRTEDRKAYRNGSYPHHADNQGRNNHPVCAQAERWQVFVICCPSQLKIWPVYVISLHIFFSHKS